MDGNVWFGSESFLITHTMNKFHPWQLYSQLAISYISSIFTFHHTCTREKMIICMVFLFQILLIVFVSGWKPQKLNILDSSSETIFQIIDNKNVFYIYTIKYNEFLSPDVFIHDVKSIQVLRTVRIEIYEIFNRVNVPLEKEVINNTTTFVIFDYGNQKHVHGSFFWRGSLKVINWPELTNSMVALRSHSEMAMCGSDLVPFNTSSFKMTSQIARNITNINSKKSNRIKKFLHLVSI